MSGGEIHRSFFVLFCGGILYKNIKIQNKYIIQCGNVEVVVEIIVENYVEVVEVFN